MQSYAIVESGGKQYKVAPGQKIDIDRLDVNKGEDVELSRVLLIADGKDTTIGSPTIEGARVTATCLGEHKGKKVIVFRYKNKVRYRRKTGHRQLHSRLEIKDIINPGGESTAAAAPKKTRKKAAGGKS